MREHAFLSHIEQRQLLAVNEHLLQRRRRDRISHESHPLPRLAQFEYILAAASGRLNLGTGLAGAPSGVIQMP
jgi:hypothetical protein